MSLALKRLQNIGWLALVFMVAILLYPLSLNVGALHNRLAHTDSEILNAKREISFLQAELRTRASMQQLEEWNDLLYGYQPPTAEQFLDDETALASLGNLAPMIKPVMVAVSAPDGAAPAGTVATFKQEQAGNPERADKFTPKLAMADLRGNAAPAATQTRSDRLAAMDAKLLSDDFMTEIEMRSKKETRLQ